MAEISRSRSGFLGHVSAIHDISWSRLEILDHGIARQPQGSWCQVPAFGHLEVSSLQYPLYIHIAQKAMWQEQILIFWAVVFFQNMLKSRFFDTKLCTPLRGHEKGVTISTKCFRNLTAMWILVESRVGATVVVPSWLERVPSYFGFTESRFG